MNGANGKNEKRRKFEKLLKDVNNQLYIKHIAQMSPGELEMFNKKRAEEKILIEKQKEIAETGWFKRLQDFDANKAKYQSIAEAEEMAELKKKNPGMDIKMK